MSERNYWLDLFTGVTWQEFISAGGNVSGFRESRWRTLQRIKSGDYLICYLTGVSRFVGALEVVGRPFKDSSPVWKDEGFPCRLHVKPLVQLGVDSAVPVLDLRDKLSFFQNLSSPHAWTGHFRGSPTMWKAEDGEAVVCALMDAQANPVTRPFDERKLGYRPKGIRAKRAATGKTDQKVATPTISRRDGSSTMKDRVIRLLPEVLPTTPREAIPGSLVIEQLKPRLEGKYSDSSLRSLFSRLAQDPTSPMARYQDGQGYYLRGGSVQTEKHRRAVPCPKTEQPEERFRAFLMRYLEMSGQHPVYIEHLNSARRQQGQNKWKYPDIVSLEWDKGLLGEDDLALNNDILQVKKALGEPPFKITSYELKVSVSLSMLRMDFFQCVSNSRWAHRAQLAIASALADDLVVEELRRLGSSFGVSVVTYGLDTILESLPAADKVMALKDDKIEDIIKKHQIRPTIISSGQDRSMLDWEHIGDLRLQNDDFNKVFSWISRCLENSKAYTFENYQILKNLE